MQTIRPWHLQHSVDYNVWLQSVRCMEKNIVCTKKTVCMKISKSGSQPYNHIKLNDRPLKWVQKAKHLGNWLTCTNTDTEDIKSKSGQFIGACNKLIAKFPCAPYEVKRILFQSYCTSYYGCQSWSLSSKNIECIYMAWRKAVRKLLILSWNSAYYLPHILN